MKITLSKNQWKQIGKTAGWIIANGFVSCDRCGVHVSDSDAVNVKDHNGLPTDNICCPRCASYLEAKMESMREDGAFASNKNKIKTSGKIFWNKEEQLDSEKETGEVSLVEKIPGGELWKSNDNIDLYYDYRESNGGVGREQLCDCGSGERTQEDFDARNISIGYSCSKCRDEKRGRYRSDIFTDSQYWHDEPIDEQ